MNYYERWPGDYGRKTAHLSLTDHGAYTLLLDTQYSTEQGLPVEYEDLYRICRAMTRIEQTAVRRIADEFFPVGQDGLRHNARADVQIAQALPRIQASKVNGRGGGRPKQATLGSESTTYDEPDSKPTGLLPDTRPGEASPVPIPHTSSLRSEGKPRTLPPGFGISERVRAWAVDKGHDRLPTRLEHFVGWARATGRKYVDWDEAFMNAIRSDWAKLDDSRSTYGRRPQTLAETRAANMAQHTGERHERTIEGSAERVDSGPILTPPSDLWEPGDNDVGRR